MQPIQVRPSDAFLASLIERAVQDEGSLFSAGWYIKWTHWKTAFRGCKWKVDVCWVRCFFLLLFQIHCEPNCGKVFFYSESAPGHIPVYEFLKLHPLKVRVTASLISRNGFCQGDRPRFVKKLFLKHNVPRVIFSCMRVLFSLVSTETRMCVSVACLGKLCSVDGFSDFIS